jgi:hypothetical protein
MDFFLIDLVFGLKFWFFFFNVLWWKHVGSKWKHGGRDGHCVNRCQSLCLWENYKMKMVGKFSKMKTRTKNKNKEQWITQCCLTRFVLHDNCNCVWIKEKNKILVPFIDLCLFNLFPLSRWMHFFFSLLVSHLSFLLWSVWSILLLLWKKKNCDCWLQWDGVTYIWKLLFLWYLFVRVYFFGWHPFPCCWFDSRGEIVQRTM